MALARVVSFLMFGGLLACTAPQLSPPRADSQLITEDEVIASSGTTAYEVIHELRPNFLSYRGETSFDKGTSRPFPNVYVDDQAYGSVSILHSIPASDVSTIRLYRSWEATTKYGTGNAGGVIAISTRR
jgi:hypothetical protein